MGTRADFYVGRGPKAQWLGSVAYDGHPENFKGIIYAPKNEKEFEKAVLAELADRDDATLPKDGWPWPWRDSHLTDYTYAWDEGTVWITAHVQGAKETEPSWYNVKGWYDGRKQMPEEWKGELPHGTAVAVFPDMRDRQNVTLGKRSGVLLFKGT
jgi:hypothetical protein